MFDEVNLQNNSVIRPFIANFTVVSKNATAALEKLNVSFIYDRKLFICAKYQKIVEV